MSTEIPSGFFAYPSTPQSIGETITAAIRKINHGQAVKLTSWEDCRTGGKIIIEEICRVIDKCDLFCADLTGLNPNVMFELGYAIAKNKRIWLIFDTTISESRKRFDQLHILTTVGYREYCNSEEIEAAFYKDQPFSDLERTIYKDSIEPSLEPGERSTLLYLKSRHDTDASRRVSKRVENPKIRVIVNDPKESSVEPLTWYGTKVYSVEGVVCHFTGQEREGANLHNARYAFVAGMSFGMDKKLLMLEEGTSFVPIDYRDILMKYQTAQGAVDILDGWLKPIEDKWVAQETSQKNHVVSRKLAVELKTFQVGEPLAENESDMLLDYFVETAAYGEALQGHNVVFVGRKGSGKTANLFKLSSALGEGLRNLVCVIKPIAYELEGIVELIKRYKERDRKGYVIESLWKFLIYSEIAQVAVDRIRNRPSQQIFEHERDLVSLYQKFEDLLNEDFTIRLEKCVEKLIQTSDREKNQQNVEQFRAAISEEIHRNVLGKLRSALGKALKETHRVAILVDNLDKAWGKNSDFNHLSQFLLGLLAVADRIPGEFRKEDARRQSVNLSLALFIRSDIFGHIKGQAKEPDKIPYSRLSWKDSELLLRVIEERFVASQGDGTSPSSLWDSFFVEDVNGIPSKTFIMERILPRPRDLVFFVKSAVAKAVNRNHSKVQASDLIEAEKEYSQYALETILVENGIKFGSLERILYEFAGANQFVNESELKTFFSKADVPESDVDQLIAHLCELSFLGLEVAAGDFRFAEDAQDYQKLEVQKRKYHGTKGGVLRYSINKPFWAFLEIKDH